jgi:hypothetical protein
LTPLQLIERLAALIPPHACTATATVVTISTPLQTFFNVARVRFTVATGEVPTFAFGRLRRSALPAAADTPPGGRTACGG